MPCACRRTEHVLNEVLSITAQEFRPIGVSHHVCGFLNEVLSITAQEWVVRIRGVGFRVGSSMKS